MKHKKESIYKISDERLDLLLKNQNLLKSVPEETDNEILKKFKEKTDTPNIRIKNKSFTLKNINFFPAAAALLIILLSCLGLAYINYYIKSTFIACKIEKSEGSVIINGKSYIDINVIKVRIGQTITTGSKSFSDLNIGSGSIIRINELSEVRIISSLKKNNNEMIKIKLLKGSIKCSVKLPTIGSGFDVLTDICSFGVKGTSFEIKINENNDIILNVASGVVEAYKILTEEIKFINNKNRLIYEELKRLSDYSISIKENQYVVFNGDAIKSFNRELKEIIKIAEENPVDIDQILQAISELENKKNNLISFQGLKRQNIRGNDNLSEKKIITTKLAIRPWTIFKESETAVVSDSERFIYISSNSDKAVYCVDIIKEKFVWKFFDKRIANINSPAVPFHDKIVLATPDMIFILDSSGIIVDYKKILKGPSFWAFPEIFKNRLYIPAFGTLYVYDGKTIQSMQDSINSGGQIYMSFADDFIYFSALNEKKAVKYSLIENKTVWESEMFLDRSFTAPLILNAFLYNAGIKGNVYKNNLKSNIKNIINIGSGIISNIISYNENLFFIAENGYLYKLNTEEFRYPKKLYLMDNNSGKDRYLTKKLVLKDHMLYYCSGTGKLFIYDLINNKPEFIDIRGNTKALIGTPAAVGDVIIILNEDSEIFKISIQK